MIFPALVASFAEMAPPKLVSIVEMGEGGNHGKFQRRVAGGFVTETLRDCSTLLLDIETTRIRKLPSPDRQGTIDLARLSPDGRYIAMRLRTTGKTDQLLIADTATGKSLRGSKTTANLIRIEWDFTGTRLAVETGQRDVFTIEPGKASVKAMTLKPGETWCWWDRTKPRLVRLRGKSALVLEPLGLRVEKLSAKDVVYGPVVGKSNRAAFLTSDKLYEGLGSFKLRYTGNFSLLCDPVLAWSPEGKRLAVQGAGYVDMIDPTEVAYTIGVDGESWLTQTAGVTDEPPTRLWGWINDGQLLVQVGTALVAVNSEGVQRPLYQAKGRILDVSVSAD